MVPKRPVLEASGIEIEANPEAISKLPSYVEDLRLHLLNFQAIIQSVPAKRELIDICEDDNKHWGVEKKPPDSIYRDTQHPSYKDRWDHAKMLRDRSRTVLNQARENHWDSFFKESLFEGIIHHTSEGSNEPFTYDADIRGSLSDGNDYQPKPDYWFGLGFYTNEQIGRLQGIETEDKGIKYFTQENVAKLAKGRGPRGEKCLICYPSKSINYGGFPWLIVELKHEEKEEDECLNQAANDSYFSMKLCEHLAEPTDKSVLPVIVITSLGPKAKVFIFYKCEEAAGSPHYRMSCIWAENFEHIWGALQLRTIVDQAMFWALRMFKPRVTECLEFWNMENTGSDPERRSSVDSGGFELENNPGDEHGRYRGNKGSFARRFLLRRPKFLRRGRAQSRDSEKLSISSHQASTVTRPEKKHQQTQTLPLAAGEDRQSQTPIKWTVNGQQSPKPNSRTTKDEGSQTLATIPSLMVPNTIGKSDGSTQQSPSTNFTKTPLPRPYAPQIHRPIKVRLPPVLPLSKKRNDPGFDDRWTIQSASRKDAEARTARGGANPEPSAPTAKVNEDTKDEDKEKGKGKETQTALFGNPIVKPFEPLSLPVRTLATPPRHLFFGPNAIPSDEALERTLRAIRQGPTGIDLEALRKPRSTFDIASIQHHQKQDQGEGKEEQTKVLDNNLAARLRAARIRGQVLAIRTQVFMQKMVIEQIRLSSSVSLPPGSELSPLPPDGGKDAVAADKGKGVE